MGNFIHQCSLSLFQGGTEVEDEELQDSPKQVSAEVTDFFYGFSFYSSEYVFGYFTITPFLEGRG